MNLIVLDLNEIYIFSMQIKQAEMWMWIWIMCSEERKDIVSLAVRYVLAAELKDYTSFNVTNVRGQLEFHSSRLSANQSSSLAHPIM